jgi:hypothetical protein
MAALEEITPAMIEAGVRTLMAGSQQRTPAQAVCDIFTRMQAAQSRPPVCPDKVSPEVLGLSTQSPATPSTSSLK